MSAALGVTAALASASVTYFGPELGHYQTAATIQRALGRSVSSERCDVVYSRAIREREARLLARDCDGHLAQIEAYFGTRGPARVRVYLFASAAEKGYLMGAARTYLAKPWRAEVYVQYAPFPHPVLGHELAHVVAGSFGRGPFRVAGPLFGVIPDPGRIEGFAVAAVADETEDLPLQDWAATLLRLEVLPPLQSVFRLGFLTQNAAAAYTVAGAFTDWFRERYGAPALRAWYAGRALSELTFGRNLAELDGTWRAELTRRPVSEAWLSTARARFAKPSFFGRHCPRVVDRFTEEATERLAAGDTAGARESYQSILTLEPQNFSARLGLAACTFRDGHVEEARSAYAALAQSVELGSVEQTRAIELTGDLEVWLGHTERALELYAVVRERTFDDTHLRQLDVKAAAQDSVARAAITALLVGNPVSGSSFEVAAVRLSAWAATSTDPALPAYLLGKNLYLRGLWEPAAEYLSLATGSSFGGLTRVASEAWRTRWFAACALQQSAAARAAYQKLAASTPPDRNHGLERLWERCFPGELR